MNKAHENIHWVDYPKIDTPLASRLLNKMDSSIDTIDDRVIELNGTKLSKTEAADDIVNVSLDQNTGTFYFTKRSGAVAAIDTALEEIVVNFQYDYENQMLVIELADGSTQNVDLSALITQYEFTDSETIAWVIGSSGTVTARIKNNSVTDDMLESGYLAQIQAKAESAGNSATSAEKSKNEAVASAESASASSADAKDALTQINKKLGLAEFSLNDDGELIYTDDTGYLFYVNENGNLLWEVA